MRTIESFEEYAGPIHEDIHEMFLPLLFGQEEPLPDEPCDLVSLTPAQGGLGMPNLRSEAPRQYAASKSIISLHVESIKAQSPFMATGEQSVDDQKKHQQSMKTTYSKSRMEEIDASLSPDLLRSKEQARDKGATSWFNAIPLKEQGLALNKQEFRDSLRLRYNLPVSDLPNHCACGDRMTVGHALSCKRGGFVAQRHDGIRELSTLHISRICDNVEVEPRFQPTDTERFYLRTTTTSPEARLDIKAGEFWSRGLTAFFDVRVTHVNSRSNQGKPKTMIFKEQENEKKRKYQQRVLDVEMGSFTSLVFGTNGGVLVECQMFLKHLTEKLSKKDGGPYG